MSYILDALKKSEEERKRGSVSDPLAAQTSSSTGRKKRALWPYLVTGALLLNAAAFTWFGIWYSKEPEGKAKSGYGHLRASGVQEPRPVISEEVNTGGRGIRENETANAQSLSSQITPVETNRKPDKAIRNRTKKQALQEIKTYAAMQDGQEVSPETPQTSVKNGKANSGDSIAPVKNKIYDLNEMPLSVRRNLPDFTVSIFLYSDEQDSRQVRINGQMLREGQYLTEGLKLEEITPDGAIFNYQNYRFRVGMK